MEILEMTRNEKSLLLCLETWAVDHSGQVTETRMNKDDVNIVKRWNGQGLVQTL